MITLVTLAETDGQLREHIDALKQELVEREITFNEYKQASREEINSMVSELQVLRKHSNIRQDQVMRREQKLNGILFLKFSVTLCCFISI